LPIFTQCYVSLNLDRIFKQNVWGIEAGSSIIASDQQNTTNIMFLALGCCSDSLVKDGKISHQLQKL